MPIPAAFAGKDVEISISVVSDPASLGLGAWVDEVKLLDSSNAPIDSADPSFESGLDGWTTPGPAAPPGEGQNPVTGWERVQSAPFVETPITTTTSTVYTGFGLEAVTSAAQRGALMTDVFEHLGAPSKPVFDAPAATTEPPAPGPAPPPAVTPPPVAPPVAIVEPPASPTALKRLTALKLRSRSLRGVLALGFKLQTTCTVSCVLKIKLTVDEKTRKHYRLARRTLGTASIRQNYNGATVLRLRFAKSVRSRLKRASRVTVTVTARQPAGRKSLVSKTQRVILR